MPSITILYFAAIRTHLATERESITLPPAESRITDLPAAILRQHPEDPKLKALLEACMWCVDEEMVDLEDGDGRVLKGGEVVAVIPPVSVRLEKMVHLDLTTCEDTRYRDHMAQRDTRRSATLARRRRMNALTEKSARLGEASYQDDMRWSHGGLKEKELRGGCDGRGKTGLFGVMREDGFVIAVSGPCIERLQIMQCVP